MRLSVAAAALLFAAAYYLYLPLPPGVCEPWKLMMLDGLFRSFMTAGDVVHGLGLLHRVHLLNWLVSVVEEVPARSCPALIVTDEALGGVATRVYRPREGGALKRAVLYFHGGGWALGSARMRSYDLLCRQMAEELDAVVMSVDYGLAPESVFPAQYEDAVAAARAFVSVETMQKYGLDQNRLCISGDSAGGNLAAAVTQTFASDPSLSAVFRVQALVYPVLQALDFHTSSYQQNQAVPILYRDVMARFWLQYLGADPALEPQLLSNSHSSTLSTATRSKINWTSLVEPGIRKHYLPIQSDSSSSPSSPSSSSPSSPSSSSASSPSPSSPSSSSSPLSSASTPSHSPSPSSSPSPSPSPPPSPSPSSSSSSSPSPPSPSPSSSSAVAVAEVDPVFLDVRAAPLLAEDGVLARTPRAYVMTCEFDVLRDDGLMYARRLRDSGVHVTSDHYGDGFHGCMVFANLPMMSSVGRRSAERFIQWLDRNL